MLFSIGKTTVARVMSKILYRLDILSTDKLVETTALDLTASVLGQTKDKVQQKLREAKGGILFIDEAYELGKSQYAEEAMTTLVAAMTDPEYRGLVIIIAGYPADIDEMLNRNAGMKSRFTDTFDFKDMEADDCVRFFQKKTLQDNYLELSGDVLTYLNKFFKHLRSMEGFGNCRDVVKYYEKVEEARATRIVHVVRDTSIIEDAFEVLAKIMILQDVKEAGDIYLRARKPGLSFILDSEEPENPLDLLDSLYRVDEIKNQLERMSNKFYVARKQGDKQPETGHFIFRGSPGTGAYK